MTEAEYNKIKAKINPNKTQKQNSEKVGRSLQTIARIMKTDTYEQYKTIVTYDHLPTAKITYYQPKERKSMWDKLKSLFS